MATAQSFPRTQSHRHPDDDGTVHYNGAAGGWGSLRGIGRIYRDEQDSPEVAATLMRQNKPRGFMCVSCAWTKPPQPHPFEFCENGAKATLWELTSRRCTPDFFAQHTVTDLREWKDHDLEHQGRLTHPLRYDRPTDKYVPCAWDDAFAAIGAELRALPPISTVFYTSLKIVAAFIAAQPPTPNGVCINRAR